jgi:hypothetical protein
MSAHLNSEKLRDIGCLHFDLAHLKLKMLQPLAKNIAGRELKFLEISF